MLSRREVGGDEPRLIFSIFLKIIIRIIPKMINLADPPLIE
jgi:hypothetical protein